MSSYDWDIFAHVETGLTVGRLAGIISGVTTILAQGFPLFAIYFMVFLVERVQTRRHDHATWTTIGSLIQSSMWPSLLQQVPSNLNITKWPPWQRRIERNVSFFSLIFPCCVVIFMLASFLTPLGLSVKWAPARHNSTVAFQAVQDLSYFGKGSQSPPTDSFQRICGWLTSIPCPGQTPQLLESGSIMFNSTLPSNITTLFTKATLNSTVAGPFDINPRHWYERSFDDVDDFKTRAVGSFQPMNSLLLENSYILVQGLIVDMHNGGIGFRNHTMPSHMKLGALWNEDILWVTPVTSCIDTNLTIHYQISNGNVREKVNGYIQDDGGFCRLAADEPLPTWSGLGTEWEQVGPRPVLETQAYHAAWWNNQLTAEILGVNSSTLGQQFSQQSNFTTGLLADTAIIVHDIDGLYLDDVWQQKTPLKSNFDELNTRCAGYDDEDYTTEPHAFVKCGYLYSASQPANGLMRQDLTSKWFQKLYTCASAVKATVNTVTFRYNGTTALPALEVVDVVPKVYGDVPPTFAIEKRHFNFSIRDIDLLWGVVDPATVESDDVAVYHTEDIFLPAGPGERNMGIRQVDTNAAGRAFQDVWQAVYAATAAIADTGLYAIPNYGGGDDFALTAKWRELSRDANGAATVLNLLWTNIAASTVSGSNTGFAPSTQASDFASRSTLGDRSVHRIVAWPAYDNWLYAIPLILGTAIFLIVGVLPAVAVTLFCKFSMSSMVHYVNQTFATRAVSQALVPEKAQPTQTNKQWLEAVGHEPYVVPPPGDTKTSRPPSDAEAQPLSTAPNDDREEGLAQSAPEENIGQPPEAMPLRTVSRSE